MTRVGVVLKEGRFGDPEEGWIKAETTEGLLINVLWHPIDGPVGAVVMPCGEIELHKLNRIVVLDQ